MIAQGTRDTLESRKMVGHDVQTLRSAVCIQVIDVHPVFGGLCQSQTEPEGGKRAAAKEQQSAQCP